MNSDKEMINKNDNLYANETINIDDDVIQKIL